MPRAPFVASSPYEPSHPSALALYCSDGRFTEAVEELLHSLGHARLDTLTMPGGPGLLNLWLSGMTDSMAVASGAKFLIEGHKIQRVILIAHEGCGYYRRQLANLAPTEIRRKQEEDLRTAANILLPARSGLRVDAYYARTTAAKGRVAFDPVGM
jgi:hypothetical protein